MRFVMHKVFFYKVLWNVRWLCKFKLFSKDYIKKKVVVLNKDILIDEHVCKMQDQT